MELTPNDVRNYEFPGKVRGYDKETVDNFRELVANRLEALTQQNLKLSMEADSLRTQLAALKQFEDAIKNAAIDARRNADQTMADAKRQAEEMLKLARTDADKACSNYSQQKTELEAAVARLELTKKSYLAKLRNLISSHLEWVDDITRTELPAHIDDAIMPAQEHKPVLTRTTVYQAEERLDVTESTELKSKTRETFATEPSKEEPIQTEEANAASRIVTVDQITTPADKTGSPIDPELEAALNNYQKVAGRPVSKESGQRESSKTDKIERPQGILRKSGQPVVPTNVAAGLEPSTVNVDVPVTEAKPIKDDSPEALARVLDNVVHKFEEEMDKAARS